MEVQIQSNSIRGKKAHEIIEKGIQEILNDTKPLLGPGATDAFIVKNKATYYTRDGMEVMESMTTDNELVNYVHHILYQAAHRQGHTIGDGTTTLTMLYCYIYHYIRCFIDGRYKYPIGAEDLFNCNTNHARSLWKEVAEEIIDKLKASSETLTKTQLKSSLYTCTQDAELAAKIYTTIGDAIMAGAYIVPRPSNISTDFQVTTYQRPTFKVTKQFSIKPIDQKGTLHNSVVYYCNGSLDMAHWEVLMQMALRALENEKEGVDELHPNIILLCHGTTDRTRATLKKFLHMIRMYDVKEDELNNIIIYTLDDYRKFDRVELDDIATIITDDPGINGVVQPITFETLMYRAFFEPGSLMDERNQPIQAIDDLETFDMDLHMIDKVKSMLYMPFTVIVDSVEGISLDKPLGPNAVKRYSELQAEIENEKSDIRKAELSKHMRMIYGMFIDVEIGSELLKDSQRKFELVLDAIISSAEGVRYGVLQGNSLLHAMKITHNTIHEFGQPTGEGYGPINGYNPEKWLIYQIIDNALYNVFTDLMNNAGEDSGAIFDMLGDDHFDIKDFDLTSQDSYYWPTAELAVERNIVVDMKDESPSVTIPKQIVEPVTVITEIIKNSTLPMELAMTKVFHIAGTRGYMNNFISPVTEFKFGGDD